MPLGVGVIGAGTVGGGVIEALLKNTAVIHDKTGLDVTLVHVAELNPVNLAPFDLEGVTVSQDAAQLISDPRVQVVCELIGGEEPAKSFILQALHSGKHVVTANKMLLAKYGPELSEAAVSNNVELRFEAAVAGTIPIIKAIRESLASNHIQGIYGILNGTCNYIFSKMTYEAQEFDNVLLQAQQQGYAETPPDLDILGWDTAHKAQILASLAYCTKVDLNDIYVEGITKVSQLDVSYAREMGYLIKLLAIIRKVDGELDVRVHPTLVPDDYLLAYVRDAFNAVYVQSDIAGPTLYYGQGAGRKPTASAVIADIIDIGSHGDGPYPPPFQYTHQLTVRDIGLLRGRYYLRMSTKDHPGVLGRISTILGQHGVSIASVIQNEEDELVQAHIVMMTHETLESSIMTALAEIDSQDFVTEPTHAMRVF
jgi:homoserine dehydrogenase